ncbi:MAG: hypothetical protein JST16_07880 [Bdellovibrionales bacterium]|nr:hypothetical protein [Bdellovibrionales bacterium]
MERNEAGTEGMVELDIHPEWDVFKGHFPGRPIFPGVLAMEAAAQACFWINMGVMPEGAAIPDVLFVSVERYRFKRPVVPPATLQIRGKEIQSRGTLFLWDVEIHSAGQLMSSGTFWMQKTPKKLPA